MRFKILLAVILVTAALTASAQQKFETVRNTDSAWERARKIKVDEKIKVHLVNGKNLKGSFAGADENGILLRLKKDKSINIFKEEIVRISRNSHGMGALIGLGVGVGSGMAIGSGVCLIPDTGVKRSESAGFGAVVFGMIGAAGGGIIGKERTIYLNPAPGTEARK
jgi:sRNA-binding regulator protein Hfq